LDFECGEETALDLDSKTAKRQEQSSDGQTVPFAGLIERGEIAIAPNEILIEWQPWRHEPETDEMVGQGD
jgi:hypothetical protein